MSILGRATVALLCLGMLTSFPQRSHSGSFWWKSNDDAVKKAELECIKIKAKAQNGGLLTDEEKSQLIACAKWDEDKRSPTYRAYIPREVSGGGNS